MALTINQLIKRARIGQPLPNQKLHRAAYHKCCYARRRIEQLIRERK
jgi:hypothetical protein